MALLVAVLACGVVCAGEPEAPAAAPGPEGEKKTSFEEPAWEFVPGDRRDPFTMIKVIPSAPTGPGPEDPSNPDKAGQVLTFQEIQQRKAEAEAYYAQAELALMESNPTDSLGKCDKGLEVFKDILQLSRYKDLQEVRERLLRLRKAAERSRTRADAERDFNLLNIRLTGVVAREKNSQAIVNAKVVGKGDVVPTNNDASDIVVQDIQPQQVVFLFRGYKMLLTMSDSH